MRPNTAAALATVLEFARTASRGRPRHPDPSGRTAFRARHMPVRPEVPVRFTSRNDTTKEKMAMGKHGKDNSDGKTSTDGNKPQGGSRGSGDKTNGNPTDGKGK